MSEETPFVPREHETDCPKCEATIPYRQKACPQCDWEPNDDERDYDEEAFDRSLHEDDLMEDNGIKRKGWK